MILLHAIGQAFSHSFVGGCLSSVLYPIFWAIGGIAPLILDRNIVSEKPDWERSLSPVDS